tara:strand:+ start:566 stop:1018 length:453 start_codon:yes stop_codon:yes gene_type:complete
MTPPIKDLKYVAIIMHGWSGSGKSTFVEQNRTTSVHDLKDLDVVASADEFFYDELGNYNFREDMLERVHSLCLSKFELAIVNGIHRVWLDNTNCTTWESEPYEQFARTHNYDVIHVFCTGNFRNYEEDTEPQYIKKQKINFDMHWRNIIE